MPVSISGQPRFSAFILKDTGRRIHDTPRPMYDYTLTASTAEHPIDAVVLRDATGDRRIGTSQALGALAQELNGASNTEDILERTKSIIRQEASSWETPDDISLRQRLMQGSELTVAQEPDKAFRLDIVKPAPTH